LDRLLQRALARLALLGLDLRARLGFVFQAPLGLQAMRDFHLFPGALLGFRAQAPRFLLGLDPRRRFGHRPRLGLRSQLRLLLGALGVLGLLLRGLLGRRARLGERLCLGLGAGARFRERLGFLLGAHAQLRQAPALGLLLRLLFRGELHLLLGERALARFLLAHLRVELGL